MYEKNRENIKFQKLNHIEKLVVIYLWNRRGKYHFINEMVLEIWASKVDIMSAINTLENQNIIKYSYVIWKAEHLDPFIFFN